MHETCVAPASAAPEVAAPSVHVSRPTSDPEDELDAALDALAAHSRPVEDLIAEWEKDPEMQAEMAARDAVREHGRVEVTVRNVISHRGRIRKEFTNLEDARRFAEDHRYYYNNCEVTVAYVCGYVTRTELHAAYPRSWHAPMVPWLVRYSVWRDVPGWETGEPDRLRHDGEPERVRKPV